MLNFIALLVCCLAVVTVVNGFQLNQKWMKISSLRMSDEIETNEITKESAETNDQKLFDMNKRVRLGRSRDQDGKSNIWSIEPTMQVVEEETGDVKKNLVVGGLVIGTAIAVLPLFAAFSSLFPDPSNY